MKDVKIEMDLGSLADFTCKEDDVCKRIIIAATVGCEINNEEKYEKAISLDSVIEETIKANEDMSQALRQKGLTDEEKKEIKQQVAKKYEQMGEDGTLTHLIGKVIDLSVQEWLSLAVGPLTEEASKLNQEIESFRMKLSQEMQEKGIKDPMEAQKYLEENQETVDKLNAFQEKRNVLQSKMAEAVQEQYEKFKDKPEILFKHFSTVQDRLKLDEHYGISLAAPKDISLSYKEVEKKDPCSCHCSCDEGTDDCGSSCH